ncbi:MAG: hypothetical protein MK066_12520, partial [Crocinitomicaceae bacterium]|nr:hypothetical protein [Crocinitomicaceae bacterium]
MTKTLLILFISFLLFGCTPTNQQNDLVWIESTCDSLPKIEFNIEEINQGMEDRINDSLWSVYWNDEYKQQTSALKNLSVDHLSLFPYQEIDSALFYFYESASKEDEFITLENRHIKNVSKLCIDKTKLLLNVINNPLNFGVGECGTNIPFSKVVLFNKGQEVGSVTFGCNYSMIST